METNESAKSPTEQLAERLRRRLLKEGLLNEEYVDKLMPMIKTGKARAEDWGVAIELSTKPKNP